LIGVDDELLLVRMQVANDDDVSDGVDVNTEVPCEQRARVHVH